MGLRDKYLSARPTATPAADIAPSTPPSAGTPSSASPAPAVSSSGPADASPATSSTPSAKRDLVALRARLSGGTNGGVNPPEAAAAVTEDLLEPNTRETPDGGAEPLPNHPDAAKAAVAAASAQPATDAASPAKRKRRTKAEMEAARAAAASTAQTTQAAGPPAPVAAPAASVAASSEPSAVVLSHGVDTEEYRTELAAASAETAGHVILTDELRALLEQEAVACFKRHLSLEGAIELVLDRMFKGMKK